MSERTPPAVWSQRTRLTSDPVRPIFKGLSVFRHIALALICLLISGGNHTALALAGPTDFQTASGESANTQDPFGALTAILFEDLREGVRAGKEQAPSKTPFCAWADPCPPPADSRTRIVPAKSDPAPGAADRFYELARAPPFRS